MPQIINTNIASLTAQRNLNNSQNALNTSLQRLSSGLRINSAKDDAAGLAISERFTSQIRGLNQAQRNANDGISLAQTAEGDLAAITNNLQRIRELAVQSANATNSPSDRAALQLETEQLIAEIDRVASTSSFNGVSLLDGSFTSKQFQVGANAGETVDISAITSARTSALGQSDSADYTVAASAVIGDLTAGQLLVNGEDVGAVTGDAAAIAAAIESATGGTVTATATNTQDITFTDVTGFVGNAASATTISPGAFVTAESSSTAGSEAGFATSADATVLATGDYTNNNVTFHVSVDNGASQLITLENNIGDTTALLADINDDLTGAVATIESDKLVIRSTATGGAVTIDQADTIYNATYNSTDGTEFATALAGATNTGADASARVLTLVGSDGVTNGGDFTKNNVTFDVAYSSGGTTTVETVTLDQNYGDRAALLAAIGGDLTGLTASVNIDNELVLTTSGGDGDGVDIAISSLVSAPHDDFSFAGNTAAAISATTDTAFSMSIDSIQLYTEGATVGGTVTAGELDTALTTFLSNNSGYTQVSGSFAGGNLQLSKADGTDIAITFDTNFSGVAGSLNTVASANGDELQASTAPSYTLSLNGTGLNLTAGGADGVLTGDDIEDAINAVGGYTASYSGTTLTVAANDGSNIQLVEGGTDDGVAIGLVGDDADTGVLRGSLNLTSLDTELKIAGTSAAQAGLTAGNYALTGTLSGTTISDTDISSLTGANNAIKSVDAALSSINTNRAGLGAIQNRFESVVSSIQTTSENLSAARSRIRDTDFAEETAALTRAQILQQAGVSILSQANSLPQNVLALLQ